MKTYKAIIALITVLAMSLSLVGCSGTTKDGTKQKVWNVAVIQTDNHPQTMAVKKMGEEIGRASCRERVS